MFALSFSTHIFKGRERREVQKRADPGMNERQVTPDSTLTSQSEVRKERERKENRTPAEKLEAEGKAGNH